MKRLTVLTLVLFITLCAELPGVFRSTSPSGGMIPLTGAQTGRNALGTGPTTLYLPLLRKAGTNLCRMGVASIPQKPGGMNVDLLKQLRAGGLIEWSSRPSYPLPGDVTYVRVLRVGTPFDKTTKTFVDNFTPTLNSVVGLAREAPTGVFQIGNEPDTCYEMQDCTLPETYAEQFFQLATLIRQNAPGARIGFGTIVQPTPLRLRYLTRAWNRLVQLAGSPSAAAGLFDFVSIHAFVLNEEYCVLYPQNPNFPDNCKWGTGTPRGFENDHADAVQITNLADTYSATIFASRLRAMRTWMLNRGLRDKPLWITEYGSLLPPFDPPDRNVANVSDATTAKFMTDTFNFMLYTSDAAIGMPADQNRLVQRWFWYSQNEYRYVFGGTLFDPANNSAVTPVGQAWLNYTAALPADETCLP